MNRTLSAAEMQLLSQLSAGRLHPSDIDPGLIRALAQEGLVRSALGQWVLSPKGALAAMRATPG